MKMLVVAMVAMLGCGKKANDCEVAVNKAVDALSAVLKDVSDARANNLRSSTVPKLRVGMIQRCTKDQWSPESIACFAAVKTASDARACQEKLPGEQRRNLTATLNAAMRGATSRMPTEVQGHPAVLSGGPQDSATTGSAGATTGSAGAATGSAGAATGSATGSAGAATGSAGAATGSAGAATK